MSARLGSPPVLLLVLMMLIVLGVLGMCLYACRCCRFNDYILCGSKPSRFMMGTPTFQSTLTGLTVQALREKSTEFPFDYQFGKIPFPLILVVRSVPEVEWLGR